MFNTTRFFFLLLIVEFAKHLVKILNIILPKTHKLVVLDSINKLINHFFAAFGT